MFIPSPSNYKLSLHISGVFLHSYYLMGRRYVSGIYPALHPDWLLEAGNRFFFNIIASAMMGRCCFSYLRSKIKSCLFVCCCFLNFSLHWDILMLILVCFSLFLGCSKGRECKSNLIDEQGDSAEGVEEPQPAPPCPPVVIDHQRLSVKHFISPLLSSVAPYLFSV